MLKETKKKKYLAKRNEEEKIFSKTFGYTYPPYIINRSYLNNI